MKNFFLKILSGSKGVIIPQAVKESFDKQFHNPLNVEWIGNDVSYEAVFYKDDMEHIASYKPDGELINLKVNLPLDAVPGLIRKTAEAHGELMNAIAINCHDGCKYELIFRDENLIRYYLLVDSSGKVIDTHKL